MQYRKLGDSGLEVSTIAFGCMSLEPGNSDSIRLLRSAMEKGINFFDTADLYDKGANEETLGLAVQAKRKSVMIATKVGNQWRADGKGWDWNPRKEYIISAVEKSLTRLRTDYIDLYQLHGGTSSDPMEETMEAFEQLKAAGKIRCYGISSIRPNVVRPWVARSGISSVMVQYSLLDRRPEEVILPLLAQSGKGVLARGAMAQGLLAGKAAKEYLGLSADVVNRAITALRKCTPPGYPLSAAALRFVLDRPGITSVVAGIRNAQQLEEACTAEQMPPIDVALYQELAGEVPANRYVEHR